MGIRSSIDFAELHDELIIIFGELTGDLLLLECPIQYKKKLFSINGEYTDEEHYATLHRVIDYINQHVKDIETLSNAIGGQYCLK